MSNRFLLAKLQTADDTSDPSLTGADAVLTSGLELKAMEGDRKELEYDRDDLGNSPSINTNPYTETSFNVDATGSGTADTPPAYGIFLEGCGFDRTVDAAGGWVEYALPRDRLALRDQASKLVFWHYDTDTNTLQKTAGARGAVQFTLSRGEISKFEFSSFMGDYNRPAAAGTLPAFDFSGYQSPLAATHANVPIIDIDGERACVESFSVDWGISVTYRNLPGCNPRAIITGYKPTAKITVEAPNIANKNFWEKAESHNGISTIPLAIGIGNQPGERVMLNIPDAQYTLTQGESDGVATFEMDVTCLVAPTVRTS